MNLVSKEIDQYCESHSTVPSSLAAELASHTRAHIRDAGMLTGALEGSFLGLMIKILGARRVLEIGTFTGYSALSMAERLPEGGEIITLDINPETNALAKSYWARSPHGRKIKPILAPALDTLTTLSGPFDLIFIDADKTGYLGYLKRALPLLSERGVILVDNCLWSGHVLDPQDTSADTKAIREFNDYVKGSPDLEATLLPLRDGVFVIRKKG